MIRDAIPDDLSTLREVRTWLAEPTPRLLEYAVSGPPLVLVSTADGRPVGYVLVVIGEDAIVAELAVSPVHRREGRATRLLRAALSRSAARGCDRARLTVHPGNEGARALYESLGFEERRRESGYYADGSDALVYVRALDPASDG